ncbi:MAG TPA: HAMP domain-containing sensor histidine kinase [Planctomycetota bacterium]|nr:HAMP domain-containing sensor histidine kinase [Planctomycetota bacterium]
MIRVKTSGGAERIIRISGGAIPRTYLLLDLANDWQRADSEQDLLDIVTHDLRAGLVPAKTYAQMLMNHVFGQLNEKQADAARIIDLTLQKQAERISTVLDLVKAEQRRLELALESASLIDVIRQSGAMLERDCARKKVQLVMDLDAAAALIEADVPRLQRTLVNILTRLLKTLNDSNSLGVELRYTGTGKARIRIWDDGPGFPLEDAETLLLTARSEHPQVSAAQKRALVELGPVADIIKGHGGTLSVNTESGAGTTLLIYVPVRQRAGAAGPNTSGPQSILVVGLSEKDVDAIRGAAEKLNLALVKAESGKQALRLARAKHYALVCAAPALSDMSSDKLLAAIAAQRPENAQRFWVSGAREFPHVSGARPIFVSPTCDPGQTEKILSELLASLAA